MGRGLLCMAGVVALWSGVPVLVKMLLPVFDPFALAFYRLLQGTAVVVAVYLLGGHSLRHVHVGPWHVIGGLGVGLNYSLFALGLSFTTAGMAVLVVQVQYVTLAVLAAAVLHERFTLGKAAGMVLVLGGVGLILGTRVEVAAALGPRCTLGNALILLSGMGWGVYALANKALVPTQGTSRILLPMLVIGTVTSGAAAATHLAPRAPLEVSRLAMLLVLGVVATGGAFLLVSEAMQRVSAALAGSATVLTPLTQITLAVIILGEPLSGNLLVGGVMILGGVLGMGLDERRRALCGTGSEKT